jgi:LysR family transcriptional regulator, cis,cis-muconate-responsive activator of cat and ben genes
VAQPHLSREIRRLEDELDVPLFARDRRRVTLTAGGSAFFEHAYRILEQTAKLRMRPTARILARRGGSVSVFGLFPDAVRRFRQRGACDRRRSAA